MLIVWMRLLFFVVMYTFDVEVEI